MRLAGPRSFIELDVLDYEFPASSPLAADRNTLLVLLRLGWHQNISTRSVPVLLTWELDQLTRWLEQLLQTHRPPPRLQFTEPCFGIECLSCTRDEYLLQIHLAHEAAPDWHHEPGVPFWLPILTPRGQIESAVYTLQQQSEKFPVRP